MLSGCGSSDHGEMEKHADANLEVEVDDNVHNLLVADTDTSTSDAGVGWWSCTDGRSRPDAPCTAASKGSTPPASPPRQVPYGAGGDQTPSEHEEHDAAWRCFAREQKV